MCRKCYIHPAVLDSFLLGTLAQLPKPRQRKRLSREEVGLMMFLQTLSQKPQDL
ncbi:hypothetical protein D3C76_1576220 [compost metagenome]